MSDWTADCFCEDDATETCGDAGELCCAQLVREGLVPAGSCSMHYADGSIDMEHHKLRDGRRAWVCWGVHEELNKRGLVIP